MSLTRNLLKEMHLEEAQIEQIIQAHAETVTALKAEIASANDDRALLLEQLSEMSLQAQDAKAIQEAFDRYKAETQAAATQEDLQRVIREGLLKAGANEKAVLLLSREIDPAQLQTEDGQYVNLDELIQSVRDKYAAFFAEPVVTPVPVIQPPASLHGALTRQDVDRMTPEEINRNWAAVRTVLAHN